MARRDGLQGFHQLQDTHPFITSGFSGAPLFAQTACGVPTGPVIGIAVSVRPKHPGAAFLLPAAPFARMRQEIHDAAFGRQFIPRAIDAEGARRRRDSQELSDAAASPAAAVTPAAEAFLEIARRSRNMLPEPYSDGLLEELVDDILAGFARAITPDPTSLGRLAADLLVFLRLDAHAAETEEREALRDLQADARGLLGALSAPATLALQAAAEPGRQAWPPGLRQDLRDFAARLLEATEETRAQAGESDALAVIEDESRAIRRATREPAPNWAALNGSAARIDDRAAALGASPLAETGAALHAALRAATHAAIAALPPLATFREHPHAPEMVVIPAGSFLMGSPEDEEDRDDDEGPQQEITFARSFALARDPISFDEYDAFCEATGRDKPYDEGWGRGRRPAIYVSWEDAQAWCAWMTEQTGAPWRLPSEAEW